MTDQPIANEEEYLAALAELARLMDLPEDAPDTTHIEPLALRIHAYEEIHYPMEL